MSELSDDRRPRSKARRHFLGLAAATTARLGAAGAVAMVSIPRPVSANNGVGWGVGGTPPGRGGGPKCFLRGTHISTERGEVKIEQLHVGDLVRTARGTSLPVKWIGRRSFNRSGTDWPKSVAPIKIRRLAINDESPRRDLFVSPTHRLLIDGYFIEAQDLVNGVSIVRAYPRVRRLEYYHLLFETHEAVFAEGAAAASLELVNGHHEAFDNFVALERLCPQTVASRMSPYATTLGSGGKEHLKALLRIGISPVFRIRDPLEEIYQRIARRGDLYELARV